ncbi:MAG TPA: CxxC-x17-CxxC domain-containing protein [Candidatus Thermoplasmatota archaeon]|nr:CxxC-x17-CxxC domain-containing protein [Candidatus Thermoplasmatota archaeon]
MYQDRAPREEFDVVCAQCGAQTTVPFKPTGTRPVLCRDCFQKSRPPRTDRPPRRDFGAGGAGGAGGGADRPSFDATCTRCGTATTVPFKPTPGRDVFCRDCFRSVRPN